MSTPTKLAFLTLLTLTLAAGAALAKKKRLPTVRNCTGEKILVCVYNGNDKMGSVASWSKSLKKGESARVKCKGNGKRRCGVKAIPVRRDGGFGCSKGSARDFLQMRTHYHITSANRKGEITKRNAGRHDKCD